MVETLIGVTGRNMHKSKRKQRLTGTGGNDTTTVMGMIEYCGEFRAFVVGSRRKEELRKHIHEQI